MKKALALAALLAVTIAMPAEAAVTTYRSNGWHVVKTNQRTTTVTLRDRTPGKTWVWVAWAKKAGPRKCRARVTYIKGGVAQGRVFEKYTRNRSKSGMWYLSRGGRSDRTITTKITTNGRCIIWAAVR